jgi:hypothetical protein
MAPINEAGTGGYVVGDMGSTNNVDTLKNIWFDENEAWEGIDEVCIVTTHPSPTAPPTLPLPLHNSPRCASPCTPRPSPPNPAMLPCNPCNTRVVLQGCAHTHVLAMGWQLENVPVTRLTCLLCRCSASRLRSFVRMLWFFFSLSLQILPTEGGAWEDQNEPDGRIPSPCAPSMGCL